MYENIDLSKPRNDEFSHLKDHVQRSLNSGSYASQLCRLTFTQSGQAFFEFTGLWCIREHNYSWGAAPSLEALLNGWV